MGSARVAQKGCIIEKEGRERFQEGREGCSRGQKGGSGMAYREILKGEYEDEKSGDERG